jgi:tetratricopeptide (TPR) repeat protein
MLRIASQVIVAALFATATGCSRKPALSEEAYREAVVAFYTGLAALETSQEVLARQQFERVIAVAPHEPAAWADTGLLLLRQQDLDGALQRLTKAAELAPDDADIQRLLGLTEGRRGNLTEAVRHWKRALQLRPGDPKAAYALALDEERLGTPDALTDAQRTLESLAERTENLVVRLEYARLAAKRGDSAGLRGAVGALSRAAAGWPADIQARFQAVQQSAASNPQAAGQSIAFLRNVLMRLPEYRLAFAAVSTPLAEVGEPLDRLIALRNPPPQPAPIDASLTFAIHEQNNLPSRSNVWVGTVTLRSDTAPVVATFDGNAIQMSNGRGWAPTDARTSSLDAAGVDAAGPTGNTTIVAADLNYDFMTDLVVHGPRGLQLLRQLPDGGFSNVTTESKLLPTALSAPATGLWAADVDTDGDLDVVEALAEGATRVLRNNGDGTFAVQDPFAATARAGAFVWADLDGDGVPDAALLDASGATHIFVNTRGGSFRERPLPPTFPKAVALVAAEVTGDSIVDLVALTPAGAVLALSRSADEKSWTSTELARLSAPPGALAVGATTLLTADLDNNGASDLVIGSPAGSQVVLRGPGGKLQQLSASLGLDVRAAADLDGDGRLELVGLQHDGRPAVATSTGTRQYHWQGIRTHAATATGDQRINSFGIGGQLEVRTGLHLQKELITGPLTHVGLGEATRSEVVRITWPNGTLQSEFNVQPDAAVAATQRLKGSCPWLFAWNGREMAFVADVLWRSPLGLRINAQTTADVLMTEDWVKLRGDQLKPRDGSYDLRITAELWETHFFDFTSLLVIDHPPGTEVFVDERFAIPPPANAVTVTGPVERLASAHDDRGGDVREIVNERDGHYLDFAGRGAYQGITRNHFVELEIPDSAPRTGPLWLIAQGWIHPTDSSINVAIAQGAHPGPRGLTLEVADAAGRFRPARTNLGFPAGKNKSILIDLAGVFEKGGRRRARLSTNMEIFWDRLGWAVGRPDVIISPRRIAPASAELRYRGYSRTEQSDPSSPERPHYTLEGTAPRWFDLEGYYTRFGDVRELLLAVDDRYVIMNAGDELLLRFPALPSVQSGAVRDYVMVTDGWEKDGDFNTTFSRTVLPLPTHASGRYDQPPRELEQDPVYQRHADDFTTYHTRYVTPDGARDALRQTRVPRP